MHADRLTLLDQAFHKLGRSSLPSLDMQGALVLGRPARGKRGVSAARLREHLAARLAGIPILRRKLVQDPLGLGDLQLVDDPSFDPLDHIRVRTLPAPGDERALNTALGEISAEELDPDRPLWRFDIIDGLSGGRIALAQKLSHATMDGTSAMKIFECLFDATPRPPDRWQGLEWQPEPAPGTLALLRGALGANLARIGVHAPRALLGLVRAAPELLGRGGSGGGDAVAGPGLFDAPRTSLNGTVSREQRNIVFANYPLDELKALAAALDCKLNDLCLAMVSEALVCYFDGIGERLDDDLVIGMPLSTRAPGQRSHGNELSVSFIDAKNSIAALPERLVAIRAQTSVAKSARAAPGALQAAGEVLMLALPPQLVDALIGLLALTQPWERLPPAMTTIMSNVAGPREAMYLAGQPIECSIPMIPVAPGSALSIGATSIGNIFSFGFHACGRVVKREHMHFFIEGLERARLELVAHARRPARARTAPGVKARAKPGRRRPASARKPGVRKAAAAARRTRTTTASKRARAARKSR